MSKANIPNIATKQLKLQDCKAGKKIVISTNWLPLFGFEKDTKVVEELIGVGQGIKIRLAKRSDKRIKKVYSREYKGRKNNPFETLMDIRRQDLLEKAIPSDTEKVHVTFKYGVLTIVPITNKRARAIEKFKHSKNRLGTFLACSSGVDGFSLEKKGFTIETLLEYRPNEKRDKNDLSETGALNALANISPKYLINEDIMNLDLEKIAELTCKSETSLFHISLQCDDFSNVKAKSLKDNSIIDTSSSLDMAYDMLRMVEKFSFPAILIENVRGFSQSDIGKMTQVRLQRLGYKVHNMIFDAREFGGKTSRVRNYMFATLLPAEFSLPTYEKKQECSLWEEFIESKILNNELREVSHSKSIQDGISTGRARVITRSSLSSPTFLKSQDRMAKDSVVIFDEIRGKIFFPSNELASQLMGISQQFDFSLVSKSIESEIIGQSIEVPLHEAILDSIKEHINSSYSQLHGKLF